MDQPAFGGASVVGKAERYAPYYPESKRDVGEKVTYGGLATAGTGAFILGRNTDSKMRRRAEQNVERARLNRTLARSRLRDAQESLDAKQSSRGIYRGITGAKNKVEAQTRGVEIADAKYKSAKNFGTEEGIAGRLRSTRRLGGGLLAAGATIAAAPYAMDALNSRRQG